MILVRCSWVSGIVGLLTSHNYTAGTSRQAELKPDLPSQLFAAVRDENPDYQNEVKQLTPYHGFTPINRSRVAAGSKITVARPRGPEMISSNSKPRRDVDDFDGEDLQLDDFLTTNERRDNTKDSSRPKVLQLDDADWLSIATTSPSPPKRVPRAPNFREDDWAAELGEQVDEEYEPIRLGNGKWACNHKCKDKTRFVDISLRTGNELTIPVASIFVAGKVWISLLQSPSSGLSLGLRRKKVSIN